MPVPTVNRNAMPNASGQVVYASNVQHQLNQGVKLGPNNHQQLHQQQQTRPSIIRRTDSPGLITNNPVKSDTRPTLHMNKVKQEPGLHPYQQQMTQQQMITSQQGMANQGQMMKSPQIENQLLQNKIKSPKKSPATTHPNHRQIIQEQDFVFYDMRRFFMLSLSQDLKLRWIFTKST